MIVFLPVSRFRIEYQVVSGRPYTVVERFLLEAVEDGTNRLDTLVDLLGIHRRVVIEGLVTLMQAGWLALSADPAGGEFVVTSIGRQVLSQDDKLPPTTQIEDRTTYVVMECVRGQIARGNSVHYQPRGELKLAWSQGVQIPKSETPYTVEPGLVRTLLWTDAEKGEYVRAVGPINIVRDSADFVVVDVDVESRRLIGLPTQWEQDLIDELIDRVIRKQKKMEAAHEQIDPRELQKYIQPSPNSEEIVSNQSEWTVPLETVSLVSGISQHTSLLVEKLERAQSCAVIVSPNLSLMVIKRLMAPVLAAIRRGVLIDVVWGWKPSTVDLDQAESLQYLTAMQSMAASVGSPGRLQVARDASRSNTSLLITDAEGRFEAVVGSNSWLGSSNKDVVSVRLTHPGPVGRLCSTASDLLGSDAHLRNSSSIIRLQNANAELDSALLRNMHQEPNPLTSSPPLPFCRVRLLRDREHYAEFQRLTSACVERIRCSSSLVRSGISRSVTRAIVDALARGHKVGLSIRGTSTLPPGIAELEKLGAIIKRSPDASSNWLIVDRNVAVVTSLNWLANPPNEARPRNFDLGISVESASFTEQLSNVLETQT